MDPLHNSKLAAALVKAKEAGIPKYTVEACFAKVRHARLIHRYFCSTSSGQIASRWNGSDSGI